MAEDIHWKNYQQRFRVLPLWITEPVEDEVGIIVCIPSLAEPHLINTLISLHACDQPPCKVEVIILFNKNYRMTSEETELHQRSIDSAQQWISEYNGHLKFHLVEYDQLPDEKGGVGWARKLAMDEAAFRLSQEGIILCLDADCEVAGNYLEELNNFFKKNISINAAGINFQHRYELLTQKDRENIIQYEMHLRYLRQAQVWCGHPYAFHTVGSSMAVRRKGYLAQGGMNTRMAGEDFYLLQKFIETEVFGEILHTTVYPSARTSNRVPFGTGRAMLQSSADDYSWKSANFNVFKEIRPLLHQMDTLYNFLKQNRPSSDLQSVLSLSDKVMDFLDTINFSREIQSIQSHTSSLVTFRKRFFRFFNAFKMIRYMHYMRDKFYPDTPLTNACDDLFRHAGVTPKGGTTEDYLSSLRHMDNPIEK